MLFDHLSYRQLPPLSINLIVRSSRNVCTPEGALLQKLLCSLKLKYALVVLQESVGIRLNQEPPRIYFKQKKTGGISFTSTCNLTKMDEKLVQTILHEYKVFFHLA